MSTLIKKLQDNKIPDYISQIAKNEDISQTKLIDDIIKGYTVIPKNKNHSLKNLVAIGKNCYVKVNANIGTSPANFDLLSEQKKVEVAVNAGADTLMDLSIAGNCSLFRKYILKQNITLGTVPIYEALIDVKNPAELSIDKFLQVMEQQAEEGVDFMTIHAGLRRFHLQFLPQRTLGIVSRGGSIIVHWMRTHGKESFLYQHFDRILKIAHEYDITLSLGDGLRPGCVRDANDAAQFGELETIGELVSRCREAKVQVMVEGPGHVPINYIEENVKKEKKICDGAPFYVLGPLVIDYAAGYDHITSAIGGALAAMHGADFLCYVTPSEHLRLPSLDDVHEGVIASKIAAGAADLAHGKPQAIKRNNAISNGRRDLNWEYQKKYSIDPIKFDKYLEKSQVQGNKKNDHHACSMCGEWCAIKRFNTKEQD